MRGISEPEGYQDLAARPGSVLWVMAATGAIVSVSPEVEAMRGYSVSEAMAQGGDQIHPPESLAASLSYFERFSTDLLAGRAPNHFHGDLEYFCKDGTTVWCETYAYPVIADDGSVVELRGVSAYRDLP